MLLLLARDISIFDWKDCIVELIIVITIIIIINSHARQQKCQAYFEGRSRFENRGCGID